MTANAPCAHIRAITTVKLPKKLECDWLYCYPDDAFAEY